MSELVSVTAHEEFYSRHLIKIDLNYDKHFGLNDNNYYQQKILNIQARAKLAIFENFQNRSRTVREH
jgi:hypothetical protein